MDEHRVPHDGDELADAEFAAITEAVSRPKRIGRKRGERMARILAGSCADCGASGLEVALYSVPDDHLTFFAGDELCEDCAGNHGVL
jgi:hypothetical protein